VVKELYKSLISLAKLPVKIVFRLCTDNDQVVDFFNTLDAKLDCDVLDDFWGEAMEVYLHNPWLTYGIGLHRLREAGLATELMDELDEKALNMSQIHQFCLEFFVGGSLDIDLCNPLDDFEAFVQDLEQILRREKPQFNPVKNKLSHWIDVVKLKAMYGRGASSYGRSSGGRQRATVRVSNVMPHNPNRGPPPPPPPPTYKRSGSAASSSSEPSRRPSKTQTPSPPTNLQEALQQWSHQFPGYKALHPLEVLLVKVPTLFPPTNTMVENHEYYFKWKEFSEDAFSDSSGDELKELLKRANRKAKFFLHPDKLPNDLTENQKFLFKTIWDVISESEAATLS
jgi:hypothetical protein